MHRSTIAFAIALVASPLALQPPVSRPAGAILPAPVDAILLVADGPTKSINGRPLVDAPLSSLGPAGLPPVDRAAQPGTASLDAGPVNGTPFSATPSGTLSEGGSQTDQHDRSLAPADAGGVVPNLGR